jgi:hypothetical protein
VISTGLYWITISSRTPKRRCALSLTLRGFGVACGGNTDMLRPLRFREFEGGLGVTACCVQGEGFDDFKGKQG